MNKLRQQLYGFRLDPRQTLGDAAKKDPRQAARFELLERFERIELFAAAARTVVALDRTQHSLPQRDLFDTRKSKLFASFGINFHA